MCAIYTDAQPTLKMAGRTQYQMFSTCDGTVGSYSLLIKFGVFMNIPMKLGITRIEPAKYQKFLLPAGQATLSDKNPTIGVVIPSVI
jgi:hypothetical protein